MKKYRELSRFWVVRKSVVYKELSGTRLEKDEDTAKRNQERGE